MADISGYAGMPVYPNKVGEQGGRSRNLGRCHSHRSLLIRIFPCHEEDGITYPAETSATHPLHGELRIIKTDFRGWDALATSEEDLGYCR